MTWQTKAMYVFQFAVIICVTVTGVLAVMVESPAIKGLLAGMDIGLVIIDIVGVLLYARYVRQG